MADSEAIVTPSAGTEEDVHQAPDDVERNFVALEDWNKRWENREIGFHKENVNELLEKHIHQLLNGREKLRIFVPLCGKTLDMKWLADMGHSVAGIDCSEMALVEFFTELSLQYVTEEVPKLNGKVFKSLDGKIRLYCGDFYSFDKAVEGKFDAVWDRGSFVAINPADRQRYRDLVTSLMDKDGRHLMSILVYNQRLYAGPPFASTVQDVKDLFGSGCVVEEIDSVDVLDTHTKWGVDYMWEKVILLQPR